MNCPVCKNSMVILELNQVEIDYCSACKGIWFDRGELDLIFSTSDKKEIVKSFSIKKDFNEVKRRCPICKRRMDKIEFENTGIILDRCSNNHGLWFDRGELKALLKSAEDNNNKIIDLLRDMFGE
ncbi:MAG: zf-TFIIB domain-containing protein [Ignavibacteriaceae bacterium]|nr:zf-TFIIB domain-containing protein [Ignavibacterium sp.]MCC6255471.1 zf-TFIIB domain-containing protein [Ignavibacteriaceae bacterium]HMN24033.1 zf-TFIIB domain-containing protein [Ignavibacteriaceae bacterium]HRN26188.1 zf-TFIIB domain-containing protein [Ignavibacteriaceae bacterium]HRP92122.1 zf-TFIIB domain-containing protein [Ignavibacteriaceae bacterium]